MSPSTCSVRSMKTYEDMLITMPNAFNCKSSPKN